MTSYRLYDATANRLHLDGLSRQQAFHLGQAWADGMDREVHVQSNETGEWRTIEILVDWSNAGTGN